MDYWTSEDKRRVPLGPIWTEDLLVLLDEPNDPDEGRDKLCGIGRVARSRATLPK